MPAAIAFSRNVLPAFGGETISPRWPRPIGEIRLIRRPGRTGDVVAGPQAEAPDLRLADVNVILARQQRFTTQESVAVVHDLEDAAGEDRVLALLRRERLLRAFIDLRQFARHARRHPSSFSYCHIGTSIAGGYPSVVVRRDA